MIFFQSQSYLAPSKDIIAAIEENEKKKLGIYCIKKKLTRMPLPVGWECKKTTGGRDYFVDHINRKTTWEPPIIHNLEF